MKMRGLMGVAAAVWLSGLGAEAHAADVGAAPAPSVRIYGGTPSATCAWPATVMLDITENGDKVFCTGSLIAPNIVAYAGHCASTVNNIWFGENIWTGTFGVVDKPARTIAMPAGACKTYPGHSPENGTDFAYCKLPTPVLDVPTVPILMGCETAALATGKQVTFVGFGRDEAGRDGIKRQVTGQIASSSSNKILFASDGNATCRGDSGGPAYIQVTRQDPITGIADNSWRVFGITSYGVTDCSIGGYDSLLSLAVPWIEADSGVDVTPCTDAYGTWQPGPNCGHFPLAPGASGNSWANGCANDQTLPTLSATCGAPYNAKAPQVTVTGPNSNTTLSGATVNLTLTAQASDGGALASVVASLDGAPVPAVSATAPTYAFGPLTLTAGERTLVVMAKDKVGVSTTVTQKFVVTGTLALNALSQDASSGGGGCNGAPNGLAWLAVLGLWMARRHRRQHNVMMACGLLAFCGLTACAGNTMGGGADLAVGRDGGLQVVSTSAVVTGEPKPQTTVIQKLASVPAESATFAGSIAGHTFTPASAFFSYQGGLYAQYMLIYIDSEAGGCDLMRAGVVKKLGSRLTLILSTTAAGEDTPTDGRYTVTAPTDAASTTSADRQATAGFRSYNATCTNVISDAARYATAGEINITTHITNNGTYATGTYENLRFGNNDVVNGSFTTQACDLSTSTATTRTCN